MLSMHYLNEPLLLSDLDTLENSLISIELVKELRLRGAKSFIQVTLLEQGAVI